MRRRFLVVMGFAAACGGAREMDLFAPATAQRDGGDEGDAAADRDATRDDEDGGGQDGAADAGPDTDGPRDAGTDRSSPRDGGEDARPLEDDIQCSRGDAGGQSCAPGTHTCCITGAGSNRTFTCRSVLVPAICSGVDLACDDRADCAEQRRPNDVCCGTLSGGTTPTVTSAACATTCTGTTKVILCDPREANPCPTGATCRLSATSLPDYFLCLN